MAARPARFKIPDQCHQWLAIIKPVVAYTMIKLSIFLLRAKHCHLSKDQNRNHCEVSWSAASHPLQVRGKRHRDLLRSRPRLELLKLPLRITIVAYQPCLLISLCTPLRRRMVSRRPLPWRNWRCRTRLKRLTLARMSRKRSRSSISLSQRSPRFKSMC